MAPSTSFSKVLGTLPGSPFATIERRRCVGRRRAVGRHLAHDRRATAEALRSPQDVRESTGHGTKSGVVREKAILALLNEKTIGTAAAKSGVNEKTLRRWLANDEAFKTDYTEARQAAYQAGLNRVQALTAKAVNTLDELLDEKKHPNVRLGAARTVAELGIHQHDAETIM